MRVLAGARVCMIALKIHEATKHCYLLFMMIKYINSNRIHSEPPQFLSYFSCSVHLDLGVFNSVNGFFVPKSDKRLIALTYNALCIWLWANSCIYIGARTWCEKYREGEPINLPPPSPPPALAVESIATAIVCIKFAINLFHAHTITSQWWLVHLCFVSR